MTRLFGIRSLLIALIVLWVTAVLAPAAQAEHVERRQTERVAYLAHELETAAGDAYYLAHHERYGYASRELTENFLALERAAGRFQERARYARSPFELRRDFRRLADLYYETRWTFRGFHGSTRVRQAFHGINAPMEELYRFYTGRDLYRDDPYVRAQNRVTPRERGRGNDGPRTRRDLDDRGFGRDGRDQDDRRGRGAGSRGRRP